MTASTQATRPVGLWLATCVSAAAVISGILQTIDVVSRGLLLSAFAPLPILIGLVLGVVGFWQMRWWGVLLALITAISITLLAAFASVPKSFLVMLAYSLPIIIASAAYRRRFRW